jgi:cytidyltransferase-like protein
MRTGFVAGTFDLFHIGHLRRIEQAKAACDRLIVGVATDECVAPYKLRSIIPLQQRMEIIAALRCVDEVRPLASLDLPTVWRELKFDTIIVGDDNQREFFQQFENWFRETGVEIIYHPRTAHISTSLLLQQIQARSDEDLAQRESAPLPSWLARQWLRGVRALRSTGLL